MSTYDILIPTIPHRHGHLCALLAELDSQIRADRLDISGGLRVHIYRDNLEATLREKNQALLDSSEADYVSWLDDDDWLAHDYVGQVMSRLTTYRPDYIGFPVEWTVDGQYQVPVDHSLRHQGWVNGPQGLTRDITALNPIRRELALLGKWDYPRDHGADRAWAEQVAATGRVRTEKYIPWVMYFYRFRTGDSFLSQRQPLNIVPQLPQYPWLTVIKDVTPHERPDRGDAKPQPPA